MQMQTKTIQETSLKLFVQGLTSAVKDGWEPVLSSCWRGHASGHKVVVQKEVEALNMQEEPAPVQEEAQEAPKKAVKGRSARNTSKPTS